MLDSHSVHTNLVHSVAAVVIQVVSWKEVWVIGYGNISGGVSSSGIHFCLDINNFKENFCLF